jgi:hypothetical protein
MDKPRGLERQDLLSQFLNKPVTFFPLHILCLVILLLSLVIFVTLVTFITLLPSLFRS